MPSPHRRIGLVVDEPVGSVLDLFRERTASSLPEARVARLALLEGGLVEALVKTATTDTADRQRAADLVAQVRELLPSLPLPGQVKAELSDALERAEARPSRAERRHRQLALLSNAGKPPEGQTAQDLADTLDAFERLPPR